MVQQYGIHYPWRDKPLNTYQIIVTENLLQRTRAENVAKYWHVFFKNVPDWFSMATIDMEQFKKLLMPFGLSNKRAKILKELAWEMIEREEFLPNDSAVLQELPGVGQYIMNAIKLLVHDEPCPLLDVNFTRVVERLFGERRMADIRTDPKLQYIAHTLVNSDSAIIINWAILDLAKRFAPRGYQNAENVLLLSTACFTNEDHSFAHD